MTQTTTRMEIQAVLLPTFSEQPEMFRNAALAIACALDGKHYLEAIALSESVMSYHLAARKANLQYQDPSRIRLASIGALVFELTGVKLNGVRETNPDALSLYLQVMDWYECKSRLLHDLLSVEDERPWAERYADLEHTAAQGAALAASLTTVWQSAEWPEGDAIPLDEASAPTVVAA